MNTAKFVIKRLRKFRSDRVLRWVFPSANKYMVLTWRRVNPRYDISGGDFDDINKWQLVKINFAHTRIGVILIELISGRIKSRPKWSDGFRQQVVEIIPKGVERYKRIFVTLRRPTIDFNDYPTCLNTDLLSNVSDPLNQIDDVGRHLDMLIKYEQAEQVSIDVRKTIKDADNK